MGWGGGWGGGWGWGGKGYAPLNDAIGRRPNVGDVEEGQLL